MTQYPQKEPVRVAFERKTVRVPLTHIQMQRDISAAVRRSKKYMQIRASIAALGIIEPPAVWPLEKGNFAYLLLDGHLRIAALQDLGNTEVTCLVSTDDEAFTYNKHVCRLATLQEHKMLLKAIERGVSSESIASALNVNPASLRKRIRTLDNVCPEVAELLKDKHVPLGTFEILHRMQPFRQIEAAENMINMNCYSAPFARAMLAATPQADLLDADKPKRVRGLTQKQMALMERESGNLEREFKMIEASHGADYLDLVLAGGYLRKLLGNARVVRYLAQHHPDLLPEFQRLAEEGAQIANTSEASSLS